jgi:nucleoid-associated protein YgaU
VTLQDPAEVAKDTFVPPAEFEEYVVKYGDTLSGIAQKFLGSQSRYQEIYEANRDRMSSPDRLDVGKPLRIPRVASSDGPAGTF